MYSSWISFFAAIPLIWSISLSDAKSLDEWTLEEVLAKVAEANGGQETIESVTNARFIGSVEQPNDSYDFLILKRRPNLMRTRMKQDDAVLETGFDGAVAWRKFEKAGYDKVEEVSDPDSLKKIKIESDFDGPLIGDLDKGLSIGLKGVERIDRIDYFVIEVSDEDSKSLHYIDSRTFREHKHIKTTYIDGADPVVTNMTFHELERHGGIWVSRRVVTKGIFKLLRNACRE